MVRRSPNFMTEAARRLPWHAALPACLHGETLDALIAWCRGALPHGDWFYPITGGDFAFAERDQAEAFAAETARIFGARPGLRDSRVTAAPPWVGARR